jgi:nucleoside-diphosphate-sugar epimerase
VRRALVIGGTGLVGRATARRLLASGWQVDVAGRNVERMPGDIVSAGGKFIHADRHDSEQLRVAIGDGADLVVDCICYTAADARLLLPLLAAVGSAVMISSKAVYVDDFGRHSNSETAPSFGGPIRETQPTLSPSDGDYTTREGYGANKVAAEHVLLDSGYPVTVLRPSKIHGEGATRPREWVFVKRVLDRRPAVFLARRGKGIDHPTAAVNIAALIETVAHEPGRRILNSADPDAPDALGIARAIAHHLNHAWEEILLDSDGPLGRHPWDKVPPIVLDTTAARDLGYKPVGDYGTTVVQEVDWLVGASRSGPSGNPHGLDTGFFAPMFDYGSEDRYLATSGR